MIGCPVCSDRSIAKTNVGKNCFRCSTCRELVFIVKNPFDTASQFAAISHVAGQVCDLPDDILLHKIESQSPIDEIPQHMILEFDGGASAILIQPMSEGTEYTEQTRKHLGQTAYALKRSLLHVYLPLELMDKIRTASDDDDVG